ncbi:hypothetical protein BDY19DRAFT_896686 [Irpex rosettiformis]|uniref:Uncharacterized protein n=1 Tax=Irpex rosettiformis TaxID=378272 RepID=A0ACB8TTZ4_9APHY|nr:hypothetical protein BDY19DRAFT_896686 [Irpex rosettiformis]
MHNGSSTVQFTSGSSAWDGPMVKNLNHSTFEWWYFDVLADDGQSSVVFAFFTADYKCLFPGTPNPGTAVGMAATVAMPDGSDLSAAVLAEEITVDTVGSSSIGWFPGGSALWAGTLDLSMYTLQFNAPQSGITGNVTMLSTAPAHFPCVPASMGAGQSLKLGDTLGWFNAIPDSIAYVNLDMNDTSVQFAGHGYHDQNWGSVPVSNTTRFWYWGHANVGPYSIVWFDYMGLDGKEGSSGYIAHNGQIMSLTCGSMQVRPTGESVIFPPTLANHSPRGFSISIDVEPQGKFRMNVQNTRVVSDVYPSGMRWMGRVQGGFVGQQQYTGNALYEQFVFS